MRNDRIGFAVLYRWRLHPELEQIFQELWASNTLRIAAERGGLGSRLHRSDDGLWIAYAQWPDRATWERSRARGPVDDVSQERMKEAIAESFPPILLDPVDDLLQRVD